MSPQEIERIGTILFGERFRSALASALGVTKGAVTHWLDEQPPAPGPVIASLKAWMVIYQTTGRRPPISPESDEEFDPDKARNKGGRPKGARYAKILVGEPF